MILLTALLLLTHDWYPKECCFDTLHECRPVPCSEVHEPDEWGGYHFRSLRRSPDGLCHVCLDDKLHQPYCLFTPERLS